MRRKNNLKKLLNLSLLDCTNLTPKLGELDMPYVVCKNIPDIDYLADYSRPGSYHQTQHTCVHFCEYDVHMDGVDGLWNAIYYDVPKWKEYYRERFQGVRYFIAPDYSKCGDVPEAENLYRQFRSRIVSIWLVMNLQSIVIPLVSCANRQGMEYMLDGMDDCEVVAFNAKGPMGDAEQMKIFIDSIKYTVDRLQHLKRIIVYSTSPDIEKVYRIFDYAIAAGIDIQVPDNMLQTRHRIQGRNRDGSNE
ncbi:DUF4417 domain-containing protein [Selenomonas sp.]|uniref:DUF4417 domain-containing protein n=1 Tax=Selenomonas sp. TaxID=2053611 RepID=UPI0026015E89|nr:DUF4417 domain-containing protein [Selenomonas sp.]MCI6285080.1 DUF4417 domain-containing protein [Selenomonas sp.]